MSITCSCDYDSENAAWYYIRSNDLHPLATKRGRSCRSCGERINPGDMCNEITRWRQPRTDMEDRIYGEGGEIGLASWYFCPHCASLASIIDEQGACFDIGENIERQLIEHITWGETCHDGGDPAAHLLGDLFAKHATVVKAA